MKNLKKVLALLVAVMVIAASMSALAEHTVVVDTTATGHTYKAYQIFTGTLSTDGNKLSDLAFGTGLTSAGQNALYSHYNLTDGNKTIDDLAAAMANDNTAQALAEALAGTSELRTANLATAIDLDAISSAVTINGTSYDHGYYKNNLADGYYLIIDTPNSTVAGNESDFYSNFIVEVIKDVVATPKGSTSTVDKKISDINDSTETSAAVDATDTADYDIGDHVPFVLDGTLASTVEMYTSYHITFEDTLSDNLANDGKYTISVLGKTIYMDDAGKFYTDDTFATEDGTKNTATTTNGTVITVSKATVTSPVTFGITVTLVNSTANDKINSEANSAHVTVSYSAELLSGATTETNKVKIKYSNNPNNNDEGTSPEDTVTVFTYEFKVNKVDGSSQPLADARFTLYKLEATAAAVTEGGTTTATGKWVQKGSETEAVAVNPTYSSTTDTEIVAGKTYYTTDGTTYTKVTTPDVANINTYYELTSVDSYTADWDGLDDGIYKLVETYTPDGYNTADPVYFTVTATHSESSQTGSYTLSSDTVTASSDTATTSAAGTVVFMTAGSNTMSVSTRTVSTTVTNRSGSTLPTTGGIGTTIFYVVGGLLALAAVVLLVTKRRMGSDE